LELDVRLANLALLWIVALVLVACLGQVSAVPTEQTTSTPWPTPTPGLPTTNPEPTTTKAIPSPIHLNPITSPLPTSAANPPLNPYAPQPGDEKLARGEVYLDLGNSDVVYKDAQSREVDVTLNGNLPDPCHKLRVVVQPPNALNEINLVVYSVYDPSLMCITVIQPFNVIIPLGILPGGHYTIYANGNQLGEVNT
jgi:hypothetical protein